jgi:hypothetical protein
MLEKIIKKPSNIELENNEKVAAKIVKGILERKEKKPNMFVAIIFDNESHDIKNKVNRDILTEVADKYEDFLIEVYFANQIPSQVQKGVAINKGLITHFYFGPDFQNRPLPEEVSYAILDGNIKSNSLHNIDLQGKIKPRD